MPGQRDLAVRSEVARADVGAACALDESRLRQVHLPGDAQAQMVIEIVGVEDHRAGVTAERAIGERIHLHERIRAHGACAMLPVSRLPADAYGVTLMPTRLCGSLAWQSMNQ